MMKYWVDKESESNNVIAVNESSIFVGSCDKESYDKVGRQLEDKRSPVEILGSDDLLVIPYSQIQNVISRSTDNDIEIKYKAKKDIEEKTLYFSGLGEANEFMSSIENYMPEHLEKSVSDQSAFIAAISPMISLTLSLSFTYLFFDKLRWPAIIIGGFWTIASIYMLSARVKEPPSITRWSISGRYFRKIWSGIKTGFSYAFLAIIIVGVYGMFPDSYGEKSIYEQLNDESLDVSEIKLLLDRGGNINYTAKDGSSSLSTALSWGEDDLAIALIEAGADLSAKDGEDTPLEYAIYNDLNIKIIESMLDKGASLEFDIEGVTPLEYSKQYENIELENLLLEHKKNM
jgi:hypothetical protein